MLVCRVVIAALFLLPLASLAQDEATGAGDEPAPAADEQPAAPAPPPAPTPPPAPAPPPPARESPPPPREPAREAAPAPRAATSPSTQGAAGDLAVDQGWDGSWALHFGLNNFLVVPGVLSSAFGVFDTVGVGGALHPSPDTGLRLGLAAGRISNPATITEEVTEFGDERTVVLTHSRPAGPTARLQLGFSADYLQRLMSTPVGPYAGAGVFGSWARADRVWRDEVTVPDVITAVNDRTDQMDLGLRGILGVEWRVHPSFALFAEYELNASIYRRTIATTQATTEATVNDERTVTRVSGSSAQTAWLNVSTGLASGFQLGLAVHFP